MITFSREQQKVIDEFDLQNHVQIIATAGAGKSRLLLELSSLAVTRLKLDPSQIMMITFTSTAGERMNNALPFKFGFSDTFHSIATVVLHKYRVLNLNDDLYSPDNVLIQFVNFLKSNSASAIAFKQSLKLVFIDEMQDNNTLMVLIAKYIAEIKELLKLSGSTVVAVGDDHQAVMGFQGADLKHFVNFPKIFHPCKVYYLSVNFRCSTPIVDLANAIMSGEQQHLPNNDQQNLLQKPQGKSFEQYMWDEHKVPEHLRISKANKPKLINCASSFDAVLKACEEIATDLKHKTFEPHEIVLIAKDNASLNRAKTIFAKKKIASKMLKHATKQSKTANRKRKLNQMQGLEDDVTCEEEDETCNEVNQKEFESMIGHVILATPFSVKGLEFKKAVLSLEHGKWPDFRELQLNLSRERRVLFTAVTRAMVALTIYNVLPKTSIFILELYQKGLLHKLFETDDIKEYPDNTAEIEAKLIKKLPLDMTVEVVDEKNIASTEDHIERFKKWSRYYSKKDLLGGCDRWVGNLNGCSLLKLTQELFPQPFVVKVTPVPILYRIPPPLYKYENEAVVPICQIEQRTQNLHNLIDITESEFESESEDNDDDDNDGEDSEFGESESDDDDDDGNDVNNNYDDEDQSLFPEQLDLAEEEDYEDAEYILPHAHSRTVMQNCLEEEIVSFLDCWVIRYLQEIQMKYSGRDHARFLYMPAETNFQTRKKKQIELDDRQCTLINSSYKIYKNPDNKWMDILLPIYWTSTCAGLYNENLSMLYNRVQIPMFQDYKFMLDDMASTIHFLIYGTKISDQTGYNYPDWQFYSFEDSHAIKKPPPYIQVGNRIVLWCNEQSDFGAFPQQVVLSALGYACLKNLDESNASVKIVQVYHTFTRKICTVSIAEWTLQKQAQYINYLRTAKKSVFDGYEEEV